MRYVSAVLFSLVLAVPALAVKHRAAFIPPAPEAIISLEIVDSQSGAPVVDVEVNTPYGFARSNRAGRLAISIPINRAVAFTFERSGYETLTDTVTITGNTERKLSLVSKPTIQVTTTGGTKYDFDAGTLQIGYPEAFLGFRLASETKACRAGGGEVVLSNDTVKRFTGPAVSATDTACCTARPVSGLDTELKSGERVRVYFNDSCSGQKIYVAGRDHVSHQIVTVAVTELTELLVR